MSFTDFTTPSISLSPASANFVAYDPVAVQQKKKRLSNKRQSLKKNPLLSSTSTQPKPSTYDEKGSMPDTVLIPDAHGSCSLDVHEPVSPTVTISGSDPSFFPGMVLLQSIVIYRTLTDTYSQVLLMNIPLPQSKTRNTTAIVTA
jgi:hypothetical protein